MENNIQAEKQTIEKKQIQDTHSDEYWSNKYDVSSDELKETENTQLLDVIIEAGIKRKSFQSIMA